MTAEVAQIRFSASCGGQQRRVPTVHVVHTKVDNPQMQYGRSVVVLTFELNERVVHPKKTHQYKTRQRPEEIFIHLAKTKALKEDSYGACGTHSEEEKQFCETWKSKLTRKSTNLSVSSEKLGKKKKTPSAREKAHEWRI